MLHMIKFASTTSKKWSIEFYHVAVPQATPQHTHSTSGLSCWRQSWNEEQHSSPKVNKLPYWRSRQGATFWLKLKLLMQKTLIDSKFRSKDERYSEAICREGKKSHSTNCPKPQCSRSLQQKQVCLDPNPLQNICCYQSHRFSNELPQQNFEVPWIIEGWTVSKLISITILTMDRKASQTTNFHDKKHSHETDVQFGMKPSRHSNVCCKGRSLAQIAPWSFITICTNRE